MGQDMPPHPAKDLAKAPSFAVWAMKDPGERQSRPCADHQGMERSTQRVSEGDDLRRGLVETRTSASSDPKTGKLPPVGNTVDIKKASYTNDIGDTQLSAVWTDPDFNPSHHAVYYVRVLEIPTPRWTTYDAKALGIDPPRMSRRPSKSAPGLHRSGIHRQRSWSGS